MSDKILKEFPNSEVTLKPGHLSQFDVWRVGDGYDTADTLIFSKQSKGRFPDWEEIKKSLGDI